MAFESKSARALRRPPPSRSSSSSYSSRASSSSSSSSSPPCKHPPLVSSKWDLILAGFSPATRLQYDGAHQRFRDWVSSKSSCPFPPPLRVLDCLLSDYLFDLYSRGIGKGEANSALFGTIMYYPHLKHSLPLSRAVLRGYSSLKMSTPHPPMPRTVCTSLAFWLAVNKKFSVAVAVLLSFDCYLRIGECIALLKDDIAFPDDTRLGLARSDRVHINIRAAKTGVLQGVEVRDPQIKALVRLWYDTTPGPRLFPFSESVYRKWYNRGCKALKVAHYTPHSLRHGGATKDYLDGVEIADISVRGRWRSVKTTTRYIQQGPQLMMLNKVPQFVASSGELIASRLVPALVLAAAG